MVAEESPEDHVQKRTPGKKLDQAWKRMVQQIMFMLETARRQMVTDYIVMKDEKIHPERTTATASSSKQRAMASGPIHQGIGEPLPRSQSHKKWECEPGLCPHGPDHMRCRANRQSKWWTCLRCGSRWARLDDTQEDVKVPEYTSENAKNVVDRRGRAFPKYLPAPRGRPGQGPREVTVAAGGRAKVATTTRATTFTNKATGATPSSKAATATLPPKVVEEPNRMVKRENTGTRPTRRAKTPTGHHNLETEIHEIYTDEETFDEEMEEIPVIPRQ